MSNMQPEEKKAFALLPEGPDHAWPFALVCGLFLLNLLIQTVLVLIFYPYADSILLNFLLTILQAALTTLPLIFIIKNYFRRPLSALGFVRAPFWRVVGIGLLSGLVIWVLMLIVSFLSALVFGPPQETQTVVEWLVGADSFGGKFMMVFMIVVLAPLSEEIFYRGFLFAYMRKYLGPVWGIIIAGFIFGLIHFELAHLLPLALTGMALCWLYDRFSNIWINILAHAAFNGIQVLLLFLLP